MCDQTEDKTFNKTFNNTFNKPVYASYALAKKEIATIAPIDYFFAKDLVQLFKLDETKRTELFHLLMALSQSLREGHVCLPISAIANTQYGYLSDDFGLVEHHGYVFSDAGSIHQLLDVLPIDAEAEQPIVYHNNNIYMRRYFQFEQELFKSIAEKNTAETDELAQVDININNKQCIDMLFPEIDEANTEIDWQKVAVANALNKNFSVIAGGPGTGKTYTVTKLLAALVYLHQQKQSNKLNTQQVASLNIALVAPTGKAAQRLSESIINAISAFRGDIADNVLDNIPTDTQTIHRLLGVIPNSPNFRFNKENRLNVDVLLIDEVSMVDLAMMNRVFKALPAHCKVILLGDADQLPSVSAGSVLNDLAPRPFLGYSTKNAMYLKQVTGINVPKVSKKQASNKSIVALSAGDNVTFLTKSRRFDGKAGIGQLSQAVIAGNYDASWALLNQATNENQITHLQGELIKWLLPLVKQYFLPIFSCKSVGEAFTLFKQFRVLCATRVGEQGVVFINELITSMLVKKGVIGSDHNFYQGRPIMVLENNYHQGLCNGDIGFLWKNSSGHLMAVFEEAENSYRWIMTSKLPHHETVYAMTIHKTQGSEFLHVAMILPNQKDNRLLSRELLYTGITRAKAHISIASNARVWRQGVETNVKRYSGCLNNL